MSALADRILADTGQLKTVNGNLATSLTTVEQNILGLQKQVADLKQQIADGAAPADVTDALTQLEGGLGDTAAIATRAAADANPPPPAVVPAP